MSISSHNVLYNNCQHKYYSKLQKQISLQCKKKTVKTQTIKPVLVAYTKFTSQLV